MHDGDLLMAEFQNGSIKAFEKIIHKYKDILYNYVIANFNLNSDESKDIIQEVFIKIYENKDTYETRNKFNSWIFKITKNIAMNYLRKKNKFIKNKDIKDIKENQNNENIYNIIDNITVKQILNEIRKLPDNQRDVLIMRYHLGYSFKEISAILSISESNAKVLAYRGLKALKESIGEIEN